MTLLPRAQRRTRSLALLGALLSFVFVTFLVFGSRDRGDVVRLVLTSPGPRPPSWSSWKNQSQSASSWEFLVERDGDDYGLSDEQCRIAFPKLFVEIEKSAARRKDKPITLKELNSRKSQEATVRGIVDRGELYVLDYEPQPVTFSRAKATLSALHRALTAVPDRRDLPSIEFVFTTEDFAAGGDGEDLRAIWSYTKRDGDDAVWLMPDFGYWSWPEVKVGPYRDVRRRIAAVDDGGVTPDGQRIPGMAFRDKKKQLLWRGSVATAPEIRGQLLRATQRKPWASVHALDWDSRDDIDHYLLPMEDHCRYMFLAHAEGRSFSGRGKYLLNCRSVVVSHRLVWREVHHAAMIPGPGPDANFVEVARDFSDLERKIEFLLDHPEVAERIANNAVATFRDRYLTPAAEACYWRHLIRRYADVCDFEPSLYADSKGQRKMRGVPFETWVLGG
ncbi:hypothetical protein VTN02DRAFT_6297 [Thermoascus thermophilus]